MEEDFIASINAALEDSPVISGATILVAKTLTSEGKIKTVFHKYYSNFVLKAALIMESCGNY